MSSEHERLAQLDAVYALGALDPAEAAEFETHMAGCGECRARVAEARDTVARLAVLDSVGAALDEPVDVAVPDTLLPGLLRRAARERRRRRLVTGGVAAAVAACAATLLVVLWPARSSDRPAPGPTVAARDFTPVTATPVRANASLVSTAWGTRIDVHCSYISGVQHSYPYRLQVLADDGDVDTLGSWTVPARGDISYVAGTSVALAHIRTVRIVTLDGTPILTLSR